MIAQVGDPSLGTGSTLIPLKEAILDFFAPPLLAIDPRGSADSKQPWV